MDSLEQFTFRRIASLLSVVDLFEWFQYFKWFHHIYMNTNSDKSHLLMSGNTKYIFHNGHNYIEFEKVQERFGITTN